MPSAIAGWLRNRGVVATPGYTVAIVPWAGSKTNTNFNTRAQDSTSLGGGILRNGGLQNAEVTWDVWLDAGTYKFALVYRKDTDAGIYTVTLNAVSQGTIDAYNAAGSFNNYSELTGLTVAAGLKELKLAILTKNASSTNYWAQVQSIALIRTGA